MNETRPLQSGPPLCSLFVYGTLKRGEEREALWPCKPITVQQAVMEGRLRDLGEYPAMVDGWDYILGELWTFEEPHIGKTLAVLDAIECFEQGGVDLYVRTTKQCKTLDGKIYNSFVYLFGEPDKISHTPIVGADEHGYCVWSALH